MEDHRPSLFAPTVTSVVGGMAFVVWAVCLYRSGHLGATAQTLQMAGVAVVIIVVLCPIRVAGDTQVSSHAGEIMATFVGALIAVVALFIAPYLLHLHIPSLDGQPSFPAGGDGLPPFCVGCLR